LKMLKINAKKTQKTFLSRFFSIFEKSQRSFSLLIGFEAI